MYINGILQARSKILKGEGTDIASERILQNGIFKNASYSVPGPNTLNYGGIYSTAVYNNSTGNAEILGGGCKTNKRVTSPPYEPVAGRRFVLKTAINCSVVRSSIKGKVVHYKFNQEGKWVRARTEMKVACQGYVYNTVCNNQDFRSKTKPATGWRKRSELKA